MIVWSFSAFNWSATVVAESTDDVSAADDTPAGLKTRMTNRNRAKELQRMRKDQEQIESVLSPTRPAQDNEITTGRRLAHARPELRRRLCPVGPDPARSRTSKRARRAALTLSKQKTPVVETE